MKHYMKAILLIAVLVMAMLESAQADIEKTMPWGRTVEQAQSTGTYKIRIPLYRSTDTAEIWVLDGPLIQHLHTTLAAQSDGQGGWYAEYTTTFGHTGTWELRSQSKGPDYPTVADQIHRRVLVLNITS